MFVSRRFVFAALLLAVAGLSLLASVPRAFAGTDVFVVDSQADEVDANLSDMLCEASSGDCTLRAAIMQANFNDGPETITVPTGTYPLEIPPTTETQTAQNGDLDIDTDLSIVGAGSTKLFSAASGGQTIIDANTIDRIFEIRNGRTVSLTGMTLRNGVADGPGGALLAGDGSDQGPTVHLDDMVLEESSAVYGGGAAAFGTLTVADSLFEENIAADTAGGLWYSSFSETDSLDIEFTEIQDGSAEAYGGAAIYGIATFNNVDVLRNEAVTVGGGMGLFGEMELFAVNVVDNDVTGTGDDVGLGGGIYTTGSDLTMSDSIIQNNTASSRGGGIIVLEQLLGLDAPNAPQGGLSFGQMNMTIDNTTIDGNSAALGGGGIRMGNGIFGGGHMTITNSTLSNNTAGSGGGFYNFGPLTSVMNMFNVTVSGNTAGGHGGGSRTTGEFAETSFSFSTIADNRADADDDGGRGGGINEEESDGVTLRNSILYNNTINDQADHENCFGEITGEEVNVVGDVADCSLSGGKITGDPVLGPLQNNGGVTQTHELGEGSAARDAATGCPPPVGDQRGVARPQGPACDVGAVEMLDATPTPTASPTPSPSGTPIPGAEMTWGDVDCDTGAPGGGVGTRDNQATLRAVLAQNPLSQTEPCPDLGDDVILSFNGNEIEVPWGDSDCDGEVTTRDNQALLRFILQQNPLSQTDPCPDLGTTPRVTRQ